MTRSNCQIVDDDQPKAVNSSKMRVAPRSKAMPRAPKPTNIHATPPGAAPALHRCPMRSTQRAAVRVPASSRTLRDAATTMFPWSPSAAGNSPARLCPRAAWNLPGTQCPFAAWKPPPAPSRMKSAEMMSPRFSPRWGQRGQYPDPIAMPRDLNLANRRRIMANHGSGPFKTRSPNKCSPSAMIQL